MKKSLLCLGLVLACTQCFGVTQFLLGKRVTALEGGTNTVAALSTTMTTVTNTLGTNVVKISALTSTVTTNTTTAPNNYAVDAAFAGGRFVNSNNALWFVYTNKYTLVVTNSF
jgi:hypothetical protein